MAGGVAPGLADLEQRVVVADHVEPAHRRGVGVGIAHRDPGERRVAGVLNRDRVADRLARDVRRAAGNRRHLGHVQRGSLDQRRADRARTVVDRLAAVDRRSRRRICQRSGRRSEGRAVGVDIGLLHRIAESVGPGLADVQHASGKPRAGLRFGHRADRVADDAFERIDHADVRQRNVARVRQDDLVEDHVAGAVDGIVGGGIDVADVHSAGHRGNRLHNRKVRDDRLVADEHIVCPGRRDRNDLLAVDPSGLKVGKTLRRSQILTHLIRSCEKSANSETTIRRCSSEKIASRKSVAVIEIYINLETTQADFIVGGSRSIPIGTVYLPNAISVDVEKLRTGDLRGVLDAEFFRRRAFDRVWSKLGEESEIAVGGHPGKLRDRNIDDVVVLSSAVAGVEQADGFVTVRIEVEAQAEHAVVGAQRAGLIRRAVVIAQRCLAR